MTGLLFLKLITKSLIHEEKKWNDFVSESIIVVVLNRASSYAIISVTFNFWFYIQYGLQAQKHLDLESKDLCRDMENISKYT